jgi:hypothetical protein
MKELLRMYEEEYTDCFSETEMGRPLPGSFFLIDLSLKGRMASYEAPESKRFMGESFWESLSDPMRERILRMMNDYEEDPVSVDTQWGEAIVFPYLLPSSALAVVSFPHPPLQGSRKKKPISQYESFMKEASVCYRPRMSRDGRDAMPVLSSRAEHLAFLWRCPLRMKRGREGIYRIEEIDLGYFSAALTLLLMLARRTLPKRTLHLTFTSYGKCCVMDTYFEGETTAVRRSEEILFLEELASRKRMVLDFVRLPNGLIVRTSLTLLDWNGEGLKQEGHFVWDEEKDSCENS